MVTSRWFGFLAIVVSLIVGVFVPSRSCFGWKKGLTGQNSCSTHNNRLLSILNILCNATQTTSIQTRDACYGCFFRAGSLSGGSTQLTALGQCAALYLTGTEYAVCTAQLSQVSRPLVAAVTACYTGYCDFVRCVRRINANNLIDGCFVENLPNRDLTVEANRVAFFTNVTSCILARTRCSLYNPITGELQNQATVATQYSRGGGIGNFVGGLLNYAALYNSLQISSAGDIRIISFPGTVSIADSFCSRLSGLEQSGYGTSTC